MVGPAEYIEQKRKSSVFGQETMMPLP